MQLLWRLLKICSTEGARLRVWNQKDWLAASGQPEGASQTIGRSSMYFQPCLPHSVGIHSMNSRKSPVSFSRGPQWSAKGKETSRLPVIQLLTSQKTIPSDNGFPAGALVSTMAR